MGRMWRLPYGWFHGDPYTFPDGFAEFRHVRPQAVDHDDSAQDDQRPRIERVREACP